MQNTLPWLFLYFIRPCDTMEPRGRQSGRLFCKENGGVLEMAKTRIELFEDALTADGMTGDSLPEYERLLKRAGNDWSRIQHCFLTAYRFPVERLEEAVQLIEFGISKYGSEPGYTIPAYEMLGTIYERAGCYQKAYDYFLLGTL